MDMKVDGRKWSGSKCRQKLPGNFLAGTERY